MTEQFKKIFIITLLFIPLALYGEKNYQKGIIKIPSLFEDYLSSFPFRNDSQQLQKTYADIVTPLNQDPPAHLQIEFSDTAASQEYSSDRSSIVQHILDTITDEAKSAIESLRLDGNGLRLPPDLTGFSNLTSLDLHNNQLITPPYLPYAPKLKTVDLSNNQITIAPFDLEWLLSLKFLDLSNNPIQSLIFVPAHLLNLEIIGIDDRPIVHEPIIQTIAELRNFLTNNRHITQAYPDKAKREDFINPFIIGGDIGSIIAAGNSLGIWTLNNKIIQALQQEQREYQRRTAPIGVLQREFYDIPTSDSREPKFFTAHSLDKLNEILTNGLEKLGQKQKTTETPEISISTAPTFLEYGLNPTTFTLNEKSKKTPILLLSKPPRTLAKSWRYWSTRGISLDQFLDLLQSGDQITSQDFTVPQFIAVDFLRDVGLTEQNSNELLSPYTKQDFVEFNESLIIKLKELLGSKTTSQTTEPIASSKEPEQQKSGAERPSKRRRIE